jgi:hypothetical protein
LNIALFIVNAKLIVSVDQLYAHVVSRLACHLILVYEIIHLLLQRVNDQVELVTLVDFLPNDRLLLLIDELFLVEVSAQRVTLIDLFLNVMLDIDKLSVFLRGLIAKDLDFVLEDLDTLFHLS